MCCLFGVLDYGNSLTSRQKNRMVSILSAECEARGTDAAGIAYNSCGELHIYKRPGPAHKLRFLIPKEARFVMGHTRMTTQGSEKHNYNNHPFAGNAGGVRFALAHNGVLHNDHKLRFCMDLPKTKIETDSFIAVQLIEQQKALDFASLKYMAEQVEGSFTFTVLDENDTLSIVKGDSPFCLYHFPKTGLFLYASTEEILCKAWEKMRISLGKATKLNLQNGDILRIDLEGDITRSKFDAGTFELIWHTQRHIPYSGWLSYEQEYLEDLKTVAASLGYDAGQVEEWLREGFTMDELEELLYAGEV